MKYFQTEGGVVIKSWCGNPEEGAVEQARNLARLPFAFRQICLMPDTHLGYGMPIGGVLAAKGVIVPNAVGVDIGCGMHAVKTNLAELSREDLKLIMASIRRVVPVGFNKHEHMVLLDSMPTTDGTETVVLREFDNARRSLGTLGGGNHFIEIQQGSDGFIYFMIHSGSRNLGKQVADHYNRLAMLKNEEYHSVVPAAYDLAFLSLQSPEGRRYDNEMGYCVRFAEANRIYMARQIEDSFDTVLKGAVSFVDFLDVAHNYARLENHFGRNVVIHRKGATAAFEGQRGIIPGSQGTASYIVEGLGNSESFFSCSHGAGRRMGRKAAERDLDLAAEIKKLDEQGVVHSVRTAKDLDEAPGAYKDIDVVMEEQKDLVKILVRLTPLGVIKG